MTRAVSRPLKIVIEILLLAGLVVLFVVLLDPKQLRLYILRITVPSLLGLLVFQVAIHTVGMLQWVVLLRQSGIRVGAWQVFRARLSGCAVTSLTPSAYFGGEPVRAALLKDRDMTYRQVFATIAVDKYIELFTKFPIAVLGFGFLSSCANPGETLVIISSVFVGASWDLPAAHGQAVPGRRFHHEAFQARPAASHPCAAAACREDLPPGP